MSAMFRTLLRTLILDDAAYRDWSERPNLFARGLILIVVVTLVAGLIAFAVDIVNRVKPVDLAEIEQQIQKGFDLQYEWNPAWKSMPPEVREMMDQQIELILPMIADIANIRTPLPKGVSGFFGAMGAYLSRVLATIGGWMLWGAMVLVAVNLLGGSAKLPDFLGMVSLHALPALLGLLSPIPCLGGVLVFVGAVWGLVIYVKAVSVASGLDGFKSLLAVIAPAIAILLLSALFIGLFVLWLILVL